MAGDVRTFTIDPHDDRVVYSDIGRIRLFRGDNRGADWRRVEKGMPWADTESYSYSHEWKVLPGESPRMIVCGASPGIGVREKIDPKGDILLSDDGGESWRVTTNGLERYAVDALRLLQHPTVAESLR